MARPPATTDNQHQVVIYEAKGGHKVSLSLSIVRDFLVTGKKELVTDQEIVFFMGICKARGLNPFAKDCYLVKFDSSPAAIITAIDFYRSRARAMADCKGWAKGVVCLKKDGELRYSNGLVLPGETLVGGWFRGQPAGWDAPLELEVNLSGYAKGNAFWTDAKAPTMIAKVAESQGLRTLWPDEFRGTMAAEEIGELSEALTAGELLPMAGVGDAPGAAPEPPDTSKFHALVDAKLKDMDPERQKEVADHLKIFLEEQAKFSSKKNKMKVTPEDMMVSAAHNFEPYIYNDPKNPKNPLNGQQQPGAWKRFLDWELMPDKPWYQEAPPVAPGAEGGPAEKAEAEAVAGDEDQDPGEETFGARVERLWSLVTTKSPPLKAMKDACGVTNLKTITLENVDAFEKFITEYEKK